MTCPHWYTGISRLRSIPAGFLFSSVSLCSLQLTAVRRSMREMKSFKSITRLWWVFLHSGSLACLLTGCSPYSQSVFYFSMILDFSTNFGWSRSSENEQLTASLWSKWSIWHQNKRLFPQKVVETKNYPKQYQWTCYLELHQMIIFVVDWHVYYFLG